VIYLDDHYFDFVAMEAYRGVDYQNFNIKRKECLVRIKYIDGEICRLHNEVWVPWMRPSPMGFIRQCHVTQAYKQWIDDEIDKMVL
jgi:hypothetical protein